MKNPYRLGYEIEPVLYAVELTPDIEKFTFKGREVLTFTAKKALSSVTLHALDLKISHVVLKTASEKHIPKKISFDKKLETVTFHFSKKIPAGKNLKLETEFEGELNDKMHGFYRTSYKVNGQTKWGAATQFEATDARRCFPCLDEPDRKAKFDVIVNVPTHLTALSNMPVLKEEKIKGENKKKIFYATSPIMPTYLLAIVIAELEAVEAKDKNGVVIRVWTTPGKKEQGLFGLDVACRALPYFAEWFDIPYALPKMDMVALPDFASGAMENWGLVTYRETALLVDAKNSSAQAKQRVAEVIDHELAHQWFGNLVTMEWWTDLWLNEGFASYMGPKAVDNQFPEWDLWTQYVVMEFLTALHDDSLVNTHPIEIDVKNPHEIREIFDHITYSKGSVVNRMLEHYLGESVFQKGLRVYLKKYAYKNAKTGDLWDVLEKVSGKPVKAIMASFTKKGGYPLIRVNAKSSGAKRILELSQSRFLFDGKKDRQNLTWNVPVGVSAEGLAKPYFSVMNKRTMTVALDLPQSGWIKMNPGQSGFYRVAYEKNLLDLLIQAIRSGRFPGKAIEYLGIADDALASARAGNTRTSECLELLTAMRTQTDYNVWTTVITALRTIESLLSEREALDKFAAFSRNLLQPIHSKIGWEEKSSDSHSDILLRSLLLSNMGHYKDAEVVAEGKKRFEVFGGTPDLKPNIRSAVYSIIASHGGVNELHKLLTIYKNTELQEEKVRVLRALTRFKDKAAIEKVLKFALTPEVRNQDTYVVLAGFGGNSAARDLNWAFVKKNWKALASRYKGSSVGLLGHILEGSVSSFASKADLADVKKFFAAHPVPGTERTRKQSLELIASNIEWKKRSENDVRDYLYAKK